MKKTLTASLLAFVVIGCGSSHGPAASATIAGVAVDDLIVHGHVKAYPASDPSKILKEGETDENGDYSLQVNYDGIATVEVSCVQGVSQMKQPDGTLVDCDPQLKLHSAAEVKPGKKVEVPVTLLTEAVVRHMDGSPTPEKLQEARQTIAAMFGVDPIGTLPTADSPSAKNYSAILEAVHKVAKDENRSLTVVINDLADDLADGQAGDDTNLTQKLAQHMRDENLSNNLTDHNGTYAPTPDEIAAADKIQAAKNLFHELRTQIRSVGNEQENGFLDLESDKISAALEHTSLDTQYLAGTIGKMFEAIGHMVDQHLTSFTPTSNFRGTEMPVVWTMSSPGAFQYRIGTAYSGSVTIPANVDFGNFNPANITTPLHASMQGTLPPLSDGTAEQHFSADANLSKSGDVVSLAFSGTIGSQNETVALKNVAAQAVFDANGSLQSMQLDSVQLHSAKGPYSFDGTLSLSQYVTNATADIEGHKIPSHITFDGKIADSNNSSSLEGIIGLVFANAASVNLKGDDSPVGTLTITGKLKMPERPMLNLMFGADNQNSQSNDYNLSYSYDATVVNGQMHLDKNGENGTMDFSSGDGVKVHIKLAGGEIDTANSSIKKDNEVIGHFEKRGDNVIIKYTDSTVESF